MQSIFGSAFSRVTQKLEETNYFFTIQNLLSSVVRSHTTITVKKLFEHIKLPFALQMILDTIFEAASISMKENDFNKFFSMYYQNPLCLKLPSSLYSLLLQVIEKRLIIYYPQKLTQELSYSILCNQKFLNFTLLTITESKQISLKTIFQLLNCSSDKSSSEILANLLFKLYGGNFMVSSKESFEQNIKYVMKCIEQYIANKNSMLNRSMKYIKGQKELIKKVDDFIILLSNFKKKQFSDNRVLNLSQNVFQGKEFIEKDVFIQRIIVQRLKKTNEKDLPLGQYLFIYYDLLVLEMSMLDCKRFQNEVQHRTEVQISNYYVDQMQKIWKKCPYNGNQVCDCKKCQCVRRNRESAKASQQKKRQAVEQVQVMRSRILDLEAKNQQLEQCNNVMRSLLLELKDHPAFKNVISRTFEPMNKIMNNTQ